MLYTDGHVETVSTFGTRTDKNFSLTTAVAQLDGDPWRSALPSPQSLPEVLVAEGQEIPIARVRAMHEGKRRARARRDATDS